MQGETISPLLFSLYVNDLEINFVKDNCPSLEIQEVSLFLLMYADDMVVVFRNRGKLQRKDAWLYNNEVLDIVDEFN